MIFSFNASLSPLAPRMRAICHLPDPNVRNPAETFLRRAEEEELVRKCMDDTDEK